MTVDNKKKCYKCKELKNLSEFYKDKSRSDGYRYECKSCIKERGRIYNLNNRDKLNSRLKKWRQNNPEKSKESCRRYYRKYRDKEIERHTKYQKENPDKVKLWSKISYQNNKEKIKENNLAYRRTKKGKEVAAKARNKRRRNLKTEELFTNPFPNDIEVDYHHVNNLLVIPLPKNLHRNVLGNTHREECNNVIMDVYGLDINKLLSEDI